MIFACFVIFKAGNLIAATTRDNGTVGLPGGKVDPGENPADCAIREANEEGWAVDLASREPVRVAEVDGKKVAWFLAKEAAPLTDYKEKARGIRPIWADISDVRKAFGNHFL
jgi:ADP-ribose pyrophosphatase YjhB (NUDIX family)